MARSIIAVGSAGNDGTGDTLRSGAIKMNSNFEELYQDVAKLGLLVADSAGGLNLEGISFDQRSVVFIGADSPNSTPADNNETYLRATEPTKDNTITLPDSTGTVALLSDIALSPGVLDSSQILAFTSTFDSAAAIPLIRQNSIDSVGVIGLVDAAYIGARTTPGLDSYYASAHIDDYVTKGYLVTNNIVLDSALVLEIIDSQLIGYIDSPAFNQLLGAIEVSIIPNSTGSRSLGSNSLRFNNLFLSNQFELDSARFNYSTGTNRLDIRNVKTLRLIDDATADSGFLRFGSNGADQTITVSGSLLPKSDSSLDLGDSNIKWRELYLSGNTIHLGGVKLKSTGGGTGIRVEDNVGSEINLGGGLTQSQVDGRITAYGTVTYDSAKVLDDSAFNRFVPAGNAGDLTIISGDGTNTLSTKTILEVSDKFFDDSADMEEGKLDRPTNQDIFNTWRKISHDTSGVYPANQSEANSWQYNSGPDTISSTVNSSTFIGFVSKDKFKDFDHEAILSSTAADDDFIGLLVGYDRPSIDSEYSLTVYRTGGGVLTGSTYGLVYNYGQSDQAVLVDGASTITVTGAGNNWSTTGQTKVLAEKRGKTLTFTTSQQPSATLDAGTELTFDLSSDSRTQRFVGKTRYGYVAQSQDAATFSNNTFTPTTPVKLIHFGGAETENFGGDVYTYDASNTQWGIDSSISLADDPGRFFHNDMTGRTFYVGQGEDGFSGYAVGSVRQFNDVLHLKPMDAEPDSASTGGLGKRAGQIAHADGINFNPDSRSAGKPYLVFYDGDQWIPMTDSVASGGGGGF